MNKFFKIFILAVFVLIVSGVVFLNKASAVCYPDGLSEENTGYCTRVFWTPTVPQVVWNNNPGGLHFIAEFNYFTDPGYYIDSGECTAAPANGATCTIILTREDGITEFAARGPMNKFDAIAPVCGTWSGAGPTFTLSNSVDAVASGVSGMSGINLAGGNCTATPGNSCNFTISDNAGNTKVCTSPIYNLTPTTFGVNATAGTGGNVTPSSRSTTGAPVKFTVIPNNGYTHASGSPFINPDNCFVNGNFDYVTNEYTTGNIGANCNLSFSFSAVSTLSCAHDTNQAEPIYPFAGAKFRATGGDGTYNWSYSATPATGNATTGNEVWPAWTGSGTKTATVSSGEQTASCTVYITPRPASMSGTLTATPSICRISLGNRSCNTSLTWSTSNPIGTSNVTSNTSNTGASAPNTVVGSGNSGTTIATVPYDSRTFFLNNNGLELDQKTVTASCDTGSVWNGTICQSGTTILNGVCASTHNNCIAGTSVDTPDTANLYKWNCNGSDGGTNASCSETKAKPDLTATAVTPDTATVGTPTTFSSLIKNSGVSTVNSFYVLFQKSETGDYGEGAGGPFSSISLIRTNYLGAMASRRVDSSSTTFSSVGTYSVRACADAGGSLIDESNEGNNCGPWTNVTVTNTPSVMTGTLTASDCTLVSGTCDTNLTWTTTYPESYSEVTTPENITVGAGLNNSATYAMTSAGSKTFYLYNNAKLLAQATATASVSPPPSCTDTTSFSGSTTPISVPIGDSYTVACDFGVEANINARVGSGTCIFRDWSNDTQANFDCTAGSTPGQFSNGCIISYDAYFPYCYRDIGVDDLTVTSPVGGRIHGICSDPGDHLHPCSSGTQSAVVNGISSWTWSCYGENGGRTQLCEELKKKPIFIED